jgi:hypothetical protein
MDRGENLKSRHANMYILQTTHMKTLPSRKYYIWTQLFIVMLQNQTVIINYIMTLNEIQFECSQNFPVALLG